MLSIVYSSHLGKLYNKNFNKHIKDTIGLNKKLYEIICYENYGEYSLTQLYNKGLKDSKNSIVVYIHNDIKFLNKNWGLTLIKYLENYPDYGIIGIAGTTKLFSESKGCWWNDPNVNGLSNYMIGSVYHKQKDGQIALSQYSKPNNVLEKSVLIDGLFMLVDKELIKTNFDESFDNFHFYDLSFSLSNYIKGVKIGVINDTNLKVLHDSVGETNNEWEKNRNLFFKKYNKTYEVNYEIKYNEYSYISSNSKLSIIIPTKDNINLLVNCVNSILENTKHENFKIYIADTGSNKNNLDIIENTLIKDNVVLIKYNYYNFAKINNDVVTNHIDKDSDYILFCNNDIKLVNNAVDQIINLADTNKENFGTIGCRLYFEDKTIQHSGIIVNNYNNNIHITHKGFKKYNDYYKNTVNTKNSKFLGNTAAFMLTKYKDFLNIKFNENYIECLEDVEYNIKMLENKCINYFVGNAVCYHYESKTRNLNPDKNKNFSIDYNYLLENNIEILKKY